MWPFERACNKTAGNLVAGPFQWPHKQDMARPSLPSLYTSSCSTTITFDVFNNVCVYVGTGADELDAEETS
jgi:hypothetical protein